jgi:hypothetical protein
MAERRASYGREAELLEKGYRFLRDDGGGQAIFTDAPKEVIEDGKANDETKTKDEGSKKGSKKG